MTTRQHSSFAIVFILGLLAMLMPLSIDMYLPALPVISAQFGVPAGSTQMTLSTYILGFALGQLIYGPMADSFGRKPVVLGGTLVFAAAAVACALAQTIDQLIVMRFFHGLAAAAASVVINALMRDIYPKEEFSRMMSFVMLVTTIAPLMAPIVGWVLVWLSWHYIFWILRRGGDSGFGNDLLSDQNLYRRSVASLFTFVPLLVTLRRCSVISVS